jgi:hypothetical protein
MTQKHTAKYTTLHTCDRCGGDTKTESDDPCMSYPAGWTTINFKAMGDFGMNGETFDLCETCSTGMTDYLRRPPSRSK